MNTNKTKNASTYTYNENRLSTPGDIKVVMISGDKRILDKESYPYRRMVGYSNLVSGLYVLVKGESRAVRDIYENNLNIYNVYADNKLAYIYGLYKKGRTILNSLSGDRVVITVQDPFFHGFVGMLLSRLYGYPLEVQVHTDITDIIQKSKLKKVISRKVLAYATGVRTVSAGARDALIKYIPQILQKIEVLPVAVDSPGFTPVAKYSINPTILVVSRLEKEKNIMFSIKIFKKLLEHIPHAKMRIVGEGSALQDLIDYTRSNNIDAHVEFAGYSNNIYEEYAAAQVLLHTARFEGFGMVFVEAGICGLPIVSTDVGVAPEITDVILESGKTEEFVEVLVALLSDKEEWQRLSAYTHKHAQKFIMSKEVYNRSIVTLWEKVLS